MDGYHFWRQFLGRVCVRRIEIIAIEQCKPNGLRDEYDFYANVIKISLRQTSKQFVKLYQLWEPARDHC